MVMNGVVDDLAQYIRRVDGGNRLTPTALGDSIAGFLEGFTDDCEHCASQIVAFVEHTNPDKRMGAGQLAELIVTEFNLEEG